MVEKALRLPSINTMSAIKRASHQGFDDGFFDNERQTQFKTDDERTAYDAGYADGESTAKRPAATEEIKSERKTKKR